MTINKNKVVSVNYHLSSHIDNEAPELVEQTTTEHPFTFIFGVGQLLPDFEKATVLMIYSFLGIVKFKIFKV